MTPKNINRQVATEDENGNNHIDIRQDAERQAIADATRSFRHQIFGRSFPTVQRPFVNTSDYPQPQKLHTPGLLFQLRNLKDQITSLESHILELESAEQEYDIKELFNTTLQITTLQQSIRTLQQETQTVQQTPGTNFRNWLGAKKRQLQRLQGQIDNAIREYKYLRANSLKFIELPEILHFEDEIETILQIDTARIVRDFLGDKAEIQNNINKLHQRLQELKNKEETLRAQAENLINQQDPNLTDPHVLNTAKSYIESI
ncbi:hypothetical protein CVV38_00635 [Candidatus Peregrinibacteria bacterium HGW-Peregrinibacteria-1]|jgi:hypothetical protein|nr:MAG: hypothetical protein CVV38_00635 [Candidatus Peregrinibacteria bacterium HGW-Peregrinibacteria-1]